MSTKDIIDDAPLFSTDPKMPTIIKVVGVGGGGNNAINHMYEQGVESVSFVVINTDRQALLNSPVPDKLLIGPNTSKGLGAGNDPEVARMAAEESAADIDKLFDDQTSMVFITAGMGGGTGTGAGPVVARIARERGLLTIGIVTIPFLFEGERKILKALDGADEMAKYVDALLVINNERLTEIYKDLDFVNGFGKADDTLSTAATSISEIITRNGYINLDFKDVETTLRNGGTAVISSGYSDGEERVREAIENALHSPLLKNRDILGSKRLLFNLYFAHPEKSSRPFKMEEANQLTNFISKLNSDVDVIWGTTFDDTLDDKVKITILAAGFNNSVRDESEALRIEKDPKPHKPAAAPAAPVVEKPVAVEPEKPAKDPASQDSRLTDIYGADKIKQVQSTNARAHNRILTVDQLDDDDAMDAIAGTPAFGRSKDLNTDGISSQRKPEPQRDNRRHTDFDV